MKHKIQISSNEKPDKSIIQEIKSFYAPEDIEITNLLVGDIVKGRCCVELKDAANYLSDISKKPGATVSHLVRQANDMQQYERPAIVVTATIPEVIFESRKLNTETPMNIKSIVGFATSLYDRFGVPVFFHGKVMAAYFIYDLLEKANDGKNPIINPIRAHATPQQEQEAILCGVYNLGPKTAISLLIHFKTVQHVINASIDQLCEVPGIGPKTATQIYELVRREYKNG